MNIFFIEILNLVTKIDCLIGILLLNIYVLSEESSDFKLGFLILSLALNVINVSNTQ